MSWNLYAYVRANPVKHLDPTGAMVLGEGEYRAIKMAKIYHQGEDAIQRYDQMQKKVAKAGVVLGIVVYGSLAAVYGGSVFIQSRYGQILFKAGEKAYLFIVDAAKNGVTAYAKTAPYILIGDMISHENVKTMFKNQVVLLGSNLLRRESALTYSIVNLGLSYISFVLNTPNASISMIRSALSVLDTLMLLSDNLPKKLSIPFTVIQQALENKMEQAMKKKKEEEEKKKKKQNLGIVLY